MSDVPRRHRRKGNRGSFKCGPDPRRHVFTDEERRRGGRTTAAKIIIHGRWPLDWLDRIFDKQKED